MQTFPTHIWLFEIVVQKLIIQTGQLDLLDLWPFLTFLTGKPGRPLLFPFPSGQILIQSHFPFSIRIEIRNFFFLTTFTQLFTLFASFTQWNTIRIFTKVGWPWPWPGWRRGGISSSPSVLRSNSDWWFVESVSTKSPLNSTFASRWRWRRRICRVNFALDQVTTQGARKDKLNSVITHCNFNDPKVYSTVRCHTVKTRFYWLFGQQQVLNKIDILGFTTWKALK